MAKITRPGDEQSLSRAGVSTGTAGQAGAGLVGIGQTLTSVGRESQNSNELRLAKQVSSMVDREGARIFEESKSAHQSSVLLNKTTEASEAFIKAQQQRYSSAVDKHGNPTFQTLHRDIGTIGKDILDRTAANIIDPEIAGKFKARFGNYIANQKISALKKARGQQVSFGRSSLDKGLGGLVTQASRDDIEQLGTYEAQGLESLQEALTGGIISHDEFEKRSREFSTVIRGTSIRGAISSNRPRAKEMLNLSSEELGIPQEEKEQLASTLDAAEKSDAVQVAKAKERQEIDNLTEETSIINDLQSRIEADVLREDELLNLEGQISPRKFSEIKGEFIRAAKARAKERKQLHGLATKISEGDDISAEKPSSINKLFDYMVNQRADGTGKDVSLADQALLATSIPTAVPSYAKKLENSVKYSPGENAEDVLSAYTYIKDRSKPTLDSGFDRDSTLIMEHTSLLVERGGVSPAEALQQSRDMVLTDDPARKFRSSEFKSIKDYKPASLEETVATELDAESFFFGDNLITSDVATTFKSFAQEGYIKTGSQDSANAYAKAMMDKTHGFSEVTTDKVYMFSPPEKAFKDVFTSEQLRTILVTENTPLIPSGVDASTISLESDDITSGQVQVIGTNAQGEKETRNVPSWLVTYEKEIDGESIRLPLLDSKTGQPKRWTPLGTTVLDDQARELEAKELEEGKAKREKRLNGGLSSDQEDAIMNLNI